MSAFVLPLTRPPLCPHLPQDFCSWGAGSGDVAFVAGVNILFFETSWRFPIAGSSVPECTEEPPPCDAGEYRRAKGGCAPCGAGTYAPTPNGFSCTPA